MGTCGNFRRLVNFPPKGLEYTLDIGIARFDQFKSRSGQNSLDARFFPTGLAGTPVLWLDTSYNCLSAKADDWWRVSKDQEPLVFIAASWQNLFLLHQS